LGNKPASVVTKLPTLLKPFGIQKFSVFRAANAEKG
jgi:hypothetical protein